MWGIIHSKSEQSITLLLLNVILFYIYFNVLLFTFLELELIGVKRVDAQNCI